MPVCNDSPEKDLTRKRKAHKKSRGGCGNCKLRRVKCDEKKPRCDRCKTFGVSCTYERASSTLQPYAEAAFTVLLPPSMPFSVDQNVAGKLNDSLRRQDARNRAFEMKNHDLHVINRFHERTSPPVGNVDMSFVYRHHSVGLAFQHSFLMHIALTLTLMHDRADSDAPRSTKEIYHWCQGIALLNNKLADPAVLTSAERDAIWVTAVLLGCTNMAQVDGSCPEDVWPLKSGPSDLDWLRFSDVKHEIWNVADLARSDNSLRVSVSRPPPDTDFFTRFSENEAFPRLPAELIILCGCDPQSVPEHELNMNPYSLALSTISRLVPLPADGITVLKFIAFLAHMPTSFRLLIEKKEPRALIILSFYYAKATEHTTWFWRKRALLEGRAVFIYLQTTYEGVVGRRVLDAMLWWPRQKILGVGWDDVRGGETPRSSPGSRVSMRSMPSSSSDGPSDTTATTPLTPVPFVNFAGLGCKLPPQSETTAETTLEAVE